ncbi:MAG: hypothetical protein ACK41T_03520 [Pseudobdellovibrio sp.]
MNKISFVIMVIFLGLFSACSNQNSGSRGAVVRAASSSGGFTLGQVTNTTCTNTSNLGYGAVYDQTSTAYNFENRVKAFLSATVNPSEVGYVSSLPNDTTGVRFEGSIKMSSSGVVDLAQTQMAIKIYDSYASTGQHDPVVISFSKATSGEFDLQTGKGSLVFKDQYGDVRFEGVLNSDYFSGTVNFSNYTHITGATAASGVLGQFYVARCGIFK